MSPVEGVERGQNEVLGIHFINSGDGCISLSDSQPVFRQLCMRGTAPTNYGSMWKRLSATVPPGEVGHRRFFSLPHSLWFCVYNYGVGENLLTKSLTIIPWLTPWRWCSMFRGSLNLKYGTCPVAWPLWGFFKPWITVWRRRTLVDEFLCCRNWRESSACRS